MATLSAIRVYPVKGLRARAVDEARVEPWGLAGDRRWMVVDPAGRFLTQRQRPAMATITAVEAEGRLRLSAPELPGVTVPLPAAGAPTEVVTVWRDIVTARRAGPDADAFLAAALGTPCHLVHMATPASARPVDPAFGSPGDRVSFADGFPLLVATEASLADLNARLVAPVPMDRFRPNIVVTGAGAWSEDGWRQIRVGAVLFEAVKPCARCVVTTVDQDTGQKAESVEPIRTLQRFRRDAEGQVIFGQNLIPRGSGTISVGDAVEVVV